MRLRALAKINLGLDILRKREDGYHEVRMIMQTIQMYDVLEMKRVRKPGISLSVNYSYIPNDERNLVYKAAKLLMDEFQVKGGVDIHLEKFIPVAAGMAGGSSDAAAALVGSNRLLPQTMCRNIRNHVPLENGSSFCQMRSFVIRWIRES